MRVKIVILLFAFFVLSCSKSERNTCKEKGFINQTEICLPNFQGFTNVKSEQKYSEFIKRFEDVSNCNMLSFFINNSTIDQSNGDPKYNYIALYSNSAMKENIDKKTFKRTSEQMESFFYKEKEINLALRKLEAEFDQNLQYDKLILIDNYFLNKNISTYILMGKVSQNNKEFITISALNFLHIRDKMVLFDFVLKYDNHETINFIKQKNDYLVLQILNINK